MINGIRVVDTTFAALRTPAYTSEMQLVHLASLIMKTGVSVLEVRPLQFLQMQHQLPPHRMIVRVRSEKELEICRQAGAAAFSAAAEDYTGALAQISDVRMAVEIKVPTCDDLFSRRYPYRPEWQGRIGIRLGGLHDIFQRGYADVFEVVRGRFGEQRVSLDLSDESCCANASALEWVLSGGRAVCASFAGAWGGAALEELLAALNVLAGAHYRLGGLPGLRRSYERLAGRDLGRFRPVTGSEIFAFESGIYADGILKNPLNYEPFAPESVGLRRRLVIGKYSGREAVRCKLGQLGIRADERQLAAINRAIRKESIRRCRSLNDHEITRLALRVLHPGAGPDTGKGESDR